VPGKEWVMDRLNARSAAHAMGIATVGIATLTLGVSLLASGAARAEGAGFLETVKKHVTPGFHGHG
jgi:hypothetical protein